MTVVAIVPAFNRRDRIAATVTALRSIDAVTTVLVVDDGSSDGTDEAARAAGATVLRLPRNRGKGAAVAAGVAAAPLADVYLLADADLAETAGAVDALLHPVIAGTADMTIAVFPSAGKQGGFGLVKGLAGGGIRRACGYDPAAPLSGQRAVRGELLRSIDLAARFGLEVGLTVDAARAGARIQEIQLPLDHRHTGRTLAGVRHRAGQGVDIVRALWPRLTSARQRVALLVVATVVTATVAAWSGGRWEEPSVAVTARADRVVIFAMPHLDWGDIGTGRLPNLDRVLRRGAAAATSVRTGAPEPRPADAFATLGAGSRARVDTAVRVERDGGAARVENFAALVEANDEKNLPSLPGALGDALAAAGDSRGSYGGSDSVLALADATGRIDVATAARGMAAVDAALGGRDDVAVVDPGLLVAAAPVAEAASGPTPALDAAKVETDRLLGALVAGLEPSTLLLVVSTVPPPGDEWRLAPLVVAGPGIGHGTLHSPSTRRKGLVTLTDLAPTVLAARGHAVPEGMGGHPLRVVPGEPDIERMRELDRDAAHREATYLDVTLAYIALQAVVYLAAIALLSRPADKLRPAAATALRLAVLAVSAWPLTTWLHRGIPDVAELGAAGLSLALVIDAAVVALALRARRHRLAPLAWIVGGTIALLLVDVATGARLQTSSLLGYSPQSAARFTGFGNTAFAVLGATTILAGALHVHHARRRREALWAAGCLFALVTFADGWPTLGSDVGGTLTLVPVLSLLLVAMTGRRLSARLVAAALVGLAAVLAVLTIADLSRAEESRTHLARLVSDIGDQGWEPLTDTVARKVATNFRTWRSPWAWSILVIAVYLVWYVGRARGWERQLPRGSALRAGAVAMLSAGLLGYAVNDSGVVVAALVFVFLGPFLTLAALEQGRDEPVLLPARPGAA